MKLLLDSSAMPACGRQVPRALSSLEGKLMHLQMAF